MNWRIFTIVFLATFGLSLPAMVSMSDFHLLGNHQGYQPAQPVAYSHSLHAGQLQIQCQYCHSAADQSRHASVPSLSTCMNCHVTVKGSTDSGKAEIKRFTDMYSKNEPACL